jgi:hypothetical protein
LSLSPASVIVRSAVADIDPDHELRVTALRRVRELSHEYDDLIPVYALRGGFLFRGERISFGSFYKGIHRPSQMRGPAALTLTTVARVPGKPVPYEDQLDVEAGAILYHYRDGPIDQPDNRARRAAYGLPSARSITWRMTATFSGSTRTASSTSAGACVRNAMGRCSGQVSRAFMASRSTSRHGTRTGPIRID